MAILQNLVAMKQKTVLALMRVFVNTAIYLQFLIFKATNDSINKVPLYMPINSRYFPLGLVSLMSLEVFLKSSEIYLIIDGKLNYFQNLILKFGHLNIYTISKPDLRKLENKLKPFNKLQEFFKLDWQGKKLLVPFIYKKSDKVLILDPDTLFLAKPISLINWILRGANNIYLEDCDNYALISPLEAGSILSKKTELQKVNTGLVGLNMNSIPLQKILPLINKYIVNIINIRSTRRTKIYPDDRPFENLQHLLEQTLFWLLFENIPTQKLDKNYYVFGKHIYKGETIGKPTFIHFAGEADKKSMYRYLFISLVKRLSSYRKSSNKPWFISNSYCYNCWHRN